MWREVSHSLPIEMPLVGDAASVWQLGEVYSIGELFQPNEEFLKAGSVEGERCEEKTAPRQVTFALDILLRSDKTPTREAGSYFVLCINFNPIHIDSTGFRVSILHDELNLGDLISDWRRSVLETSYRSKKVP